MHHSRKAVMGWMDDEWMIELVLGRCSRLALKEVQACGFGRGR